jgi:hypothetical protein
MPGVALTKRSYPPVAWWGRRAGKVGAVVALACAGLLVTDASGKLGVDRPHLREDRHVRGEPEAIRAKLAPVSSSSAAVSWLTS